MLFPSILVHSSAAYKRLIAFHTTFYKNNRSIHRRYVIAATNDSTTRNAATNATTTNDNALCQDKDNHKCEVVLNYQKEAPMGKMVGRYVAMGTPPDQGELVDEMISHKVVINNARQMDPPASLNQHGFTKCIAPSILSYIDFMDPDLVKVEYYAEIRDIIREHTGATMVGVLDHTLYQKNTRTMTSSNNNNNDINDHNNGNNASHKINNKNQRETSIHRGHCDYTDKSAPFQFWTMAKNKSLFTTANEVIPTDLVEQVLAQQKRFAFINVWRSTEHPKSITRGDEKQMVNDLTELAVCDAQSVLETDRIRYTTRYPKRREEHFVLKYNRNHQWYAYPQMSFQECLLYTVYDTQEPQFVFHTSFTDPRANNLVDISRQFIEVRTIAIF